MIASGFAFRLNNEVTSSDVDKPLCYAQPYLNTSRKLAHQICKSPYVAFLSALGVILPSSAPKRLVFNVKRIEANCVLFVYCFEYGEHLHGGIRWSAHRRSGYWRPGALKHRSVHRCRRFQCLCYFKYWCICKRYICISFAFMVAVAILLSLFPFLFQAAAF